MMHFFARLADGNAAREQLLGLLKRDTERNLMTFSRGGVAVQRRTFLRLMATPELAAE